MPTPLSRFGKLALGACLALSSLVALAAPKTVCTITVNSPDEKDTFRRYLPPGDYRFVELVERGRPDWLASSCQAGVQCDALIISGHFDGGTEFYTDRFDVNEHLSVEEMERASCSDSCPGVFSKLKEVYLFGCNTLKPEPRQAATDEIVRALLRAGHQPADAARVQAMLGDRHAESNRDRMRHIFKDVPLIYGFSSLAPLGRYAGPLLDRWFQQAPVAPDIGSGQVNARLLELFDKVNMTVTSGLTDGESQARVRGDTCRFLDDRVAAPRKVAFMHEVLQRDVTEVRMLFGHLERFASAVGPAQRTDPATGAAFAAIAADHAARDRFLGFARDADELSVRVRMMALARNVGWLTPAQEQTEFLRTIADGMARDRIGKDEVAMACARGDAGADPALPGMAAGALKSGKVAQAAALACLGSPEARTQVVRALTSPRADDVAMAQAYLRHRPLADAGEVRALASAIVRMPASDAQVRALEALARQRLADADTLREIAGLFPLARSVQVQRAIAGILIRSDHRLLGSADLARSLKQYRIKSPDGDDVIDALIRILQAG